VFVLLFMLTISVSILITFAFSSVIVESNAFPKPLTLDSPFPLSGFIIAFSAFQLSMAIFMKAGLSCDLSFESASFFVATRMEEPFEASCLDCVSSYVAAFFVLVVVESETRSIPDLRFTSLFLL